ncbi:MAG TPA: alpha-amlyase [Methanothermococcus okinawensis]|uniref:Alpha-amlyase n=1 Tax=Methanothermococcus okinawensis TaxID=155863 RepID=A0A832YTD2_9EURY|nr:alpha-amlyase [Methanothermococcus okinawensis]
MLISFNFEVHQPHRLKKEVVNTKKENLWDRYIDIDLNKKIFNRVADKCYIPTNNLMLELIDEYNIKVAYSITGVFLEQAMEFNEEVLDLFKDLVNTGNVELIGETYHHSLSSLFEDHGDFKEDIERHRKLLKELFNYESKVFRNTELIYNNRIAQTVNEMGFNGIFTEGADRILEWRSPNYVYRAPCGIKVLLRNYRLSDDIGFRFSSPQWEEYPLTADKYASWLANSHGDCINLYIDYETFGEHQWRETGIFEFLKHLPKEIENYPNLEYGLPSEIIEKCITKGEFNVLEFSTVSWADSERDISAWLGNKMQKISFDKLKKIRELLGRYVKTKNETLEGPDNGDNGMNIHKDIIEYKVYKNLQTSDNFYYQCTKGFNDMDVHSYFSHFETPYDAYAAYMDVIYDFKSYMLVSYVADKYSKRIESLKEKIGMLNKTLNEKEEFIKDTSELENLINKIKGLEEELFKKDKEIKELRKENSKLIKELLSKSRSMDFKRNNKDSDIGKNNKKKNKERKGLNEYIIGS